MTCKKCRLHDGYRCSQHKTRGRKDQASCPYASCNCEAICKKVDDFNNKNRDERREKRDAERENCQLPNSAGPKSVKRGRGDEMSVPGRPSVKIACSDSSNYLAFTEPRTELYRFQDPDAPTPTPDSSLDSSNYWEFLNPLIPRPKPAADPLITQFCIAQAQGSVKSGGTPKTPRKKKTGPVADISGATPDYTAPSSSRWDTDDDTDHTPIPWTSTPTKVHHQPFQTPAVRLVACADSHFIEEEEPKLWTLIESREGRDTPSGLSCNNSKSGANFRDALAALEDDPQDEPRQDPKAQTNIKRGGKFAHATSSYLTSLMVRAEEEEDEELPEDVSLAVEKPVIYNGLVPYDDSMVDEEDEPEQVFPQPAGDGRSVSRQALDRKYYDDEDELVAALDLDDADHVVEPTLNAIHQDLFAPDPELEELLLVLQTGPTLQTDPTLQQVYDDVQAAIRDLEDGGNPILEGGAMELPDFD